TAQDGDARSQRFQVNNPETLPITGHDKGIGQPVMSGLFRLRNSAGEDYALAQAELPDLGLQTRAVRSIADDQVGQPWNAPGQEGECLEDLFNALGPILSQAA